jgi:predicted TIM-barrel fold metal-dependent hydrolase
MTVDALVVAGENLFEPAVSLEQLVADSTASGIDTVIAAPGRPRTYALPPANDDLAATAEGLSGVWRLARVDPRQGAEAVAEARRCLTELRCVGLFLHPGEENFDLADCHQLVSTAAALDRPVVVVAGVPNLSEPLQLLELARGVPDARLVATNGGHVNISGLGLVDAWAALSRASNLYVVSNGVYRHDYLERVVHELGSNRLLFGSLAPVYDQLFELSRVRGLSLDAESRARVEDQNARRIFGLS